jgi:hypothetical protein
VPAPESKVEEIDWKAKAREWESRAKANKTAADRLAEIEEANKTEAQKAAEKTATAEKRAVEAEAKVLRRDVAIEHKLTSEDAALLDTITDENAMRALAARLAGAESDRKTQGLHVPGEGKTPTAPAADGERETARKLFGG